MEVEKIKTLTIQQIPALVQIDFKVRDLDVELEVFFHGIDVIEDVIDNPRDDTLHGGIIYHSLHGVGLPRRCLTVCKDGSIITTQHI